MHEVEGLLLRGGLGARVTGDVRHLVGGLVVDRVEKGGWNLNSKVCLESYGK